jgi:hypothetical protein
MSLLPILMAISYQHSMLCGRSFFKGTLSNLSCKGCGGISLVHILRMFHNFKFFIYHMTYLTFQGLLLELTTHIIFGVVN